MQKLSHRLWLFLFSISSLSLISAYVMEFYFLMEPCNLCILQRFVIIGIIILAIAGITFKHVVMQWIFSIFISLATLIGVIIGARHVWLQHLPASEVPLCGPNLDYLLERFPIWESIKIAFQGSGDCAEAGSLFLGLSLAVWTVILMCILHVASEALIVVQIKTRQRKN
ncbi:MAG: disulfide bond formation protein B [Pseudomonadota bacterium]